MGLYGTADLVLRAGEDYRRTFTRVVDDVAQPWTDRVTRLQMRTPYGNELLIELTAFLEIDPDDATKLHLDLPGSFTFKMHPEGRWDLYSTLADGSDPFRLPTPSGRILVLQGVTYV